MRRMYQEQESVFYYISLMNENYTHPEMPEGAEEGIIKGMYKLKSVGEHELKVKLLGSGTILREVEAAAQMLNDDWQVASDIWSVTSFNELAREGMEVDRYNRLHPADNPKKSYVEQCLGKSKHPVISSTDYMQMYSEQIRPWIDDYHVLGTDGFGRSDTREKLRDFFEVDRYHIVTTALLALSKNGLISKSKVVDAMSKYNISPNKPNPFKS
jgi:pyruvate dehydrogenase E1 component